MSNTITSYFTQDGLPALGLTPTIRIWETATNNLVVSDEIMAEIGGGFYKYVFAGYNPLLDYVVRADGGPSLSGAERYTVGSSTLSDEKIADTVWDEPKAEHTVVGSVAASIDSMQALLETLRKYEGNRTRIDPDARTLTIYDDDGTTPMQIFNLYNATGSPSIASVAERAPTL